MPVVTTSQADSSSLMPGMGRQRRQDQTTAKRQRCAEADLSGFVLGHHNVPDCVPDLLIHPKESDGGVVDAQLER